MSIIKGTNKIVAGFGGTKRSIGEVYFSQSALATDNSGALPLFTGETIASANTIYPEFYNWVSAHKELQCTSAEYESALSTYGECPKYVIVKTGDNATAPDYGDATIAAGSIRLPKLSNYIKAANTSEGITQKEAGLPNHDHITHAKGTFSTYYFSNDNKSFSGGGGSSFGTSKSPDSDVRTGDASESNSVYGKSDTVTPASTTLYPWVVAYTSAIPASMAQAAEFQQGLRGKAETNLGNTTPSQSFKEMSVGWCMPDYSAVVTCTPPFTAPSNGFISYNTSGTVNCTVNGNTVYVGGNDASNEGNVTLYLSKNDVIAFTRDSGKACFVPCKGVN